MSKTVSLHRMEEAHGQCGAGRSNRVSVGNRASFDVDNVLRKAQLLCHSEWDRRERFVDLDSLYVGESPSCSFQGLLDSRDRTQAEHAGLDRGHAVGDKPSNG